MGTPGVKSNITKHDIVDALKRNHGVISQAAVELGITRQGLNQIMRGYPDIMEQLPLFRANFEEHLLDTAEATVQYCMNLRKEKTAVALRAATYVLDKRGAGRGWEQAQEIVDAKTEGKFDELIEAIEKHQLLPSSEAKTAESNINSETKSE